jgi:uncharacterized protein
METQAQNCAVDAEAPSANGWFQLNVPADGLIATVKKIVRHTGNGKPVKAVDILKKLKQLKVVYGIDQDAIESLLTSVEDNDIPEAPVVIAKGDVENGGNGSIEWCIEGITEENAGFLVVPNVKIAVKKLASQGKKGKNVFGKSKNPRPGFDQALNHGEGVAYTQETDGVLDYKCTQAGLLHYKAGTLSVDSGLNISENKLQVHIDIYAGKVTGSGAEVTEADILNTLEVAGIKDGINTDQIKSSLEEARLAGVVVNNVLVAEGEAPVNGSDSVVEWHLDAQSEDINKRAVLPGLTIASIKSNTESKPGVDVFGEVVAGIEGTVTSLECDEGVEEVIVNDVREYKALRLGVVNLDTDTLSVKSGIQVSDDKLKVTMTLLRPDIATDEGNILLKHVKTTLEQNGIVYGIKSNAIELILGNINKERKSKSNLLIAAGDPPVNGVDDVIEWHLDTQAEDINKRAVLPGQTIATLKSNSKSKPGIDVFEEVISGVDGIEASLDCGKGVEKIKVNGVYEYKALGLGVAQLEADTISVKSGVKISDDKLKVTMDLLRSDIATEEANILLQHVIITLNERDIVYGIKNDAIKLMLESINKERISMFDVLVAEGLPAMDGVDTKIDFDKELSSGGKLLPNGEIDFHEKSYPWNVITDDVIGKVIPPKRSEDGKDVMGEVLIANPVKESAPVLEGVVQEADGTLRALEDGILLVNGISFKVSDNLELNGDVCQKTGNIDSDKTVNVKGYVEAGFVLKTKGDAIIQENVEDATVNAEGNVVIKSGVRGTHCKVISGGSLAVSFAENADLNAKGDIHVTNSVINCHTVSQGKVYIGDAKSRKSALVGDVTQAIKGVEVAILGSDSFNKTIVEVGAGNDSYMKLKELVDEILSAKKGIADISKLHENCCKNPKSQKEQNALLLKLTSTLDLKNQEYNNLLEEKEALTILMQDSKDAKVVVHKRVYPGVVIRIMNKLYEVREERNSGEFVLKADKIVFEPS